MENEAKSNRILLIVVAAVTLTACTVFPCGLGAGWLGRGVTASKDAIAKSDGGPVNREDGWTYQKLQDHLASKGLTTSRGAVAGGMFFMIDSSNKPLPIAQKGLDEPAVRDGWLRSDEAFFVFEHQTPDAAKQAAAREKDVKQISVFTWNRFVFRCDPSAWERLKTKLP